MVSPLRRLRTVSTPTGQTSTLSGRSSKSVAYSLTKRFPPIQVSPGTDSRVSGNPGAHSSRTRRSYCRPMVTPPGNCIAAAGLQWYSNCSACKIWICSGSRTPWAFKKRSSARLRRAGSMAFNRETSGTCSSGIIAWRQASSCRSSRAIADRFSPMRGFSARIRGRMPCRIRLRRKSSVPLELSSTWGSP